MVRRIYRASFAIRRLGCVAWAWTIDDTGWMSHTTDTPTKARALAKHIQSLDTFILVDYFYGNYRHMGATIADAILQAGTKYETVVRPRVRRIREEYPEASTTSAFLQLLQDEGPKTVLWCRDDEKPNRVVGSWV